MAARKSKSCVVYPGETSTVGGGWPEGAGERRRGWTDVAESGNSSVRQCRPAFFSMRRLDFCVFVAGELVGDGPHHRVTSLHCRPVQSCGCESSLNLPGALLGKKLKKKIDYFFVLHKRHVNLLSFHRGTQLHAYHVMGRAKSSHGRG